MLSLWEEFKRSSSIIKLTLLAIVVVWLIGSIMFVVGLVVFWESPGQAQQPAVDILTPTITLEPAIGMTNTPVTVRGQGWSPDSTVLIYLASLEKIDIPDYAIANATVDPEGQFTAVVIISADSRWENSDMVKVIARSVEGQATTQAFFSLIDLSSQPIETPITLPEPTIIPTIVVQEPTSTPTLTPTPLPENPVIVATTAVNIRSGPGTNYAVLGLLQTDQKAEVTGISSDANWWQIRFTGSTDERGWVSGRYVAAQNTGNVPVVQPPVLLITPTPTPRPVPVVITDWQGEYYNNSTLSGAPALVRNDVSVNFDWGTRASAPGINADNFSVRWIRSFNFPAGTYRFYTRVDDGVRLWVDGALVIDRWHDTSLATYHADVNLTNGSHSLRMEYYERTGTAIAQLAWEWLEAYPDWKGEYYNNPNLSGVPVLVRNDPALQFSWGPSSPGSDVPADNFSVRWTRDLYFSAGTYRFKVLVDDGARLWIDGNLLIDQWHASDSSIYTGEKTLSEGFHSVRLEYFDLRYDAQVRLDWERLSSNYPDWKAEYFDNRRLEGNPVLVRNEMQINYNWGGGSPAAGIPADNFSARWSRRANFQSGAYLLRVKVDDGVRLWFDDILVIDSWQDGGVRTLEAERQVSEGQHRLRVEYYERSGEARIEVSWQKKEAPANQAPQANSGGPYTVDEGSPITFNGQLSKDPDGTIVSYEWDFDYKDGTFTVDANGPTTNTGYPDGPATIVIALRVKDDKGSSNVGVTQVAIKNVAPTVEAGGPYVGQVNNPITVAGTATDPGLIDQTGLSYQWDFGDGSQGSGPVVSHSYAQAGSYTIKLTVTDKDGGQGTDVATVQVNGAANQPPQAAINGPTSGLTGETLNFSGSNSSDPDGNIVSYDWDFGDGSADNGINVSHIYSTIGSYTVSLTVTDNDGLTAKTTLLVQINEPVPVPELPIAVIDDPGSNLVVGDVIDFSGSNSSDPDGSIVSYDWDFGDGYTGTGVNVSHVYVTAGSYTVSLTVTDNSGLTATTTLFIQINEMVGPAPF